MVVRALGASNPIASRPHFADAPFVCSRSFRDDYSCAVGAPTAVMRGIALLPPKSSNAHVSESGEEILRMKRIHALTSCVVVLRR